MKDSTQRELLLLVDALCEDRASRKQLARLEELVLESPAALRLYVEAMSLHGTLHWDAAGLGADIESGLEAPATDRFSKPQATRALPARNRERSFRRLREIATGVAVLVVLKLGFALFDPQLQHVAVQLPQVHPAPEMQKPEEIPRQQLPVPDVRLTSPANVLQSRSPSEPRTEESVVATNPAASVSAFQLVSDEQVVEQINQRLLAQWVDADVTPASSAPDAEWVRRIYLDLAGRIPTGKEASHFFAENNPAKRERLVDSLLHSREFARHLATVWTNLLVGRARDQNIDREKLFAWMDDEFQRSRPWQEIVSALVSARGTAESSGPANFLLAHLNNEAVPATAITARIFLCEQLQCTQCHQHPTVKSWGQERFWELNAFFQQAGIRDRKVVDSRTGQSQVVRELIDAKEFGPTYYESLRGVMQVAYPKFGGVEIPLTSEKPEIPLREQLTELLFADSHPQPARAFVNRTWAQLMGQGFTTPIDDMGPHTVVSHPELLEELTAAFVQSGYDVPRLVRWICLSDAYQLTSRPPKGIADIDMPALGERPLFSRMYVKSLSAEQLFDSLRIASGVTPRQLAAKETQRVRERWLKQFYSAVDTEENGESSTFDGSLPQALMMMNGDLVRQATDPSDGLVIADVAGPHGVSEAERIRQLSLAALSRYPTSDELSQLRVLLRRSIRQRVVEENIPPQLALAEGLKDVYWAYLNSSEFSMNH